MATIIIKKELQEFLEKEGVLESFIENVKNEKTFRNDDIMLIININTAFRWRLTEKKGEGGNYWSEINTKWNTYKRKNGIV